MLLWRNSNKSEEWRRKVITLNWKWHFELFHKQIGWLGSLSLLKYIQVLGFSIGARYAIKANCLTCSAPISIKWHTGRIWNQFAKFFMGLHKSIICTDCAFAKNFCHSSPAPSQRRSYKTVQICLIVWEENLILTISFMSRVYRSICHDIVDDDDDYTKSSVMMMMMMMMMNKKIIISLQCSSCPKVAPSAISSCSSFILI